MLDNPDDLSRRLPNAYNRIINLQRGKRCHELVGSERKNKAVLDNDDLNSPRNNREATPD
jgi:hypothetical protein